MITQINKLTITDTVYSFKTDTQTKWLLRLRSWYLMKNSTFCHLQNFRTKYKSQEFITITHTTTTTTTTTTSSSLVSLRNKTAERRGRDNAWVLQTWQGYDLRVLIGIHLTLTFFVLLQKDLFKGMWGLVEVFFKHNYCHACHTRFAVVFPLPSGCVSSLLVSLRNRTAGRRGRQNACAWQTWQGYYLRVLTWSSLNTNVFWPFTKRSV